jgi:hypothetical protein
LAVNVVERSCESVDPIARVDVRGFGRISKRGVLVHAPTLRYYVGRYCRNVMLLVRGWWFRLVFVYLQNRLDDTSLQNALRMVAP